MPSNATFTTYPQFANAAITVSNTSELNAAIASLGTSGGGTILLDGAAGPFNIQGNGIGDAANPILIKPLDPSQPPLVQNIALTNASHITMTGLQVDSSASPAGVQDLRISGSDHIEFVGNTMSSTANGLWDGSASISKGANAALIRNSSDINFSGNTISGYFYGPTFLESSNVNFSGNDISQMQGDGFRAGGLQNATIDGNHMHDFYGGLHSIVHNDFIQFWSANAQMVTKNIVISNNVLDANGGASAQGIFIGNEQMRHGGTGHYYENIKVIDNVIHTAMWHGIRVESTKGVEITGNSVLQDDHAFARTDATSPPHQGVPWIMTVNTQGTLISGNTAGKINQNGTLLTNGQNTLLDYKDPATAQFIDAFMASAGASVASGSSVPPAPPTPPTGSSTAVQPPDTGDTPATPGGQGNTDHPVQPANENDTPPPQHEAPADVLQPVSEDDSAPQDEEPQHGAGESEFMLGNLIPEDLQESDLRAVFEQSLSVVSAKMPEAQLVEMSANGGASGAQVALAFTSEDLARLILPPDEAAADTLPASELDDEEQTAADLMLL